MNEIVISVSQLNFYIRKIFDAEELLFNISVKGEISGFKIVKDIAFFNLKDENCQISCVCFNADSINMFKDGDLVIARGSPKFYVKGGRLDFNVNKLTQFGKGDIFLKFLQLKEQLEKEGLFDIKYKKNLPQNIKRIGVITSETGAVLQDILDVSKRRNHGIDIVIYPASVQGDNAENEIIKGINFFSNYNVDAIIIARGGGSFEDLNIFNLETIARCAFNCLKVIISAIGHETDFTILDFVADIRAPTPSAAAEIITSDLKEKSILLNEKYKKLNLFILNILSSLDYKININQHSFLKNLENTLEDNRHYLTLKTAILNGLNPSNILKSGYAKVSKKNKIITSSKQLIQNDNVIISFYDGEVLGTIK